MKAAGYKLSEGIVDPKTGQPPRIATAQQFLIWKFLKKPREVNWAREGKIASLLLEQCDSIDFWNFVDLAFQLNSLAWFNSTEGKTFLSRETDRYKFLTSLENKEKKQVVLSDKLVGENMKLEPAKPKTLFDFIKRK